MQQVQSCQKFLPALLLSVRPRDPDCAAASRLRTARTFPISFSTAPSCCKGAKGFKSSGWCGCAMQASHRCRSEPRSSLLARPVRAELLCGQVGSPGASWCAANSRRFSQAQLCSCYTLTLPRDYNNVWLRHLLSLARPV